MAVPDLKQTSLIRPAAPAVRTSEKYRTNSIGTRLSEAELSEVEAAAASVPVLPSATAKKSLRCERWDGESLLSGNVKLVISINSPEFFRDSCRGTPRPLWKTTATAEADSFPFDKLRVRNDNPMGGNDKYKCGGSFGFALRTPLRLTK